MRTSRLMVSSAVCAVLVLVTALPSAASNDKGEYLALGDSVAFGFNPLRDRSDAANFVGYPEVLGDDLDLQVINASCPGEASGGFISLSGTDNVCRPYRFGSPFNPPFPLHVQYTTSQLDFAVAFLHSHADTRLITIDIGANDLFVLENQCKKAVPCIQQGLPALLATLSTNLGTIYRGLNQAATGKHQLVALTYYSTDYRDPVGVAVISAINQTVAAATLRAGGRVADGFGSFQIIASRFGGDSCAAGLLIKLPTGGCDIHPSPRGRATLAKAIGNTLHPEDGD